MKHLLIDVSLAIAGLALSGMPPFTTAIGKSIIESASEAAGRHWVTWVFLVGSAFTGGATLRAGARIYYGWGPDTGEEADGTSGDEKRETHPSKQSTPPQMPAVTGCLIIVAMLIGLVPNAGPWTAVAADRFGKSGAYVDTVLANGSGTTLPGTGAGRPNPMPLPSATNRRLAGSKPGGEKAYADAHIDAKGVVFATASSIMAVLLVPAMLFRRRIPERTRKYIRGPLLAVFKPLRELHTGHVGDYVAWITVGTAIYGLILMAGSIWHPL